MTAIRTTDPATPEKGVDPGCLERLPASVRKLVLATPEKEWSKIRAHLVESEEEGELVEMLPDMNRVMSVCPKKLLKRVLRRELSAQDFDQGFRKLHDALHGVRQAIYAILQQSGCKIPDSKPGESDEDVEPESGPAEAAPPKTAAAASGDAPRGAAPAPAPGKSPALSRP
jgi:hypothetical protein